MQAVLLVHGAYGSPQSNWQPWLSGMLSKKNCRVLEPQFPTPHGQSLDNWLEIFEPYRKPLGDSCIAVGHSIGATFLLSVLERQKSNAAFLVSGFISQIGIERFDKINATFFKKEFDWNAIKSNCKNIHIIHGDDDPYVPLSKAYEISEKLGCEVTVVKGGGHFSTSTTPGYDKFQFLLDEIMKEI